MIQRVFPIILLLLSIKYVLNDIIYQDDCSKSNGWIKIDTSILENAEIIVDSSDEVYFYEVPPTPFSVSKRYIYCKENSSICNSTILSNTINVPLNKFHKTTVYELNKNLNRVREMETKYFHSFEKEETKFDTFIKLENNLEIKEKQREEEFSSKLEIMNKLSTLYGPLKNNWNIIKHEKEIFDPQFLELIYSKFETKSDLLTKIVKETDSGIYSFQLFTIEFCNQLVEEVERIQKSGINTNSPNTMNNFGVILDNFGMFKFLNSLMHYVMRLTTLLFPNWGGDSLVDHHGFVVEYKIGKDEKLDYHMDSSDITLNVCLGKNFEGGSLFFNGVRNQESEKKENFKFDHVPGKALLHVGQHWHGAKRITSGERYNMILWMMSRNFRASAAEHFLKKCNLMPKCNGEL
jgi:hypothetical protein